jgi:hypothetical protein
MDVMYGARKVPFLTKQLLVPKRTKAYLAGDEGAYT